MKVTIELSSIDELRRVLNALDGFESKPMPMMEPAAPKQQYQKPEVLPQAPAATTTPAIEPAPAPAAEEPKKAPSFEEVTKAAIKLMDAGRQNDLRQLLTKYGVQALPELKADMDKLRAFYADLEVM